MRKFLITLSLVLMTMSSNLFAQEITPGKEVDLGLPSGTIWAGWNVGATSPEEYGDYYAWGEIATKKEYSEESYKYYNKTTGGYVDLGSNISGTKYDVARQKWGGSWRIPTKAEFEELILKCTWTWCLYKRAKGYKFTGPNGNSIFLPAAGLRDGTSLTRKGLNGYYWSASLYEADYGYNARRFYFIDVFPNSADICDRCAGLSVRPVKSK